MDITINTLTHRWGNSIAVIIPSDIVNKRNIKENQEIVATFGTKKPLAGELFGRFPRKSSKTAQEIKDELRAGWESDSDREREAKWEKKLIIKR